jgi:hypothetical protein
MRLPGFSVLTTTKTIVAVRPSRCLRIPVQDKASEGSKNAAGPVEGALAGLSHGPAQRQGQTDVVLFPASDTSLSNPHRVRRVDVGAVQSSACRSGRLTQLSRRIFDVSPFLIRARKLARDAAPHEFGQGGAGTQSSVWNARGGSARYTYVVRTENQPAPSARHRA